MSSAYRGVSWYTKNGVWVAQMTHDKKHGGDGKQKFLGIYYDERSAALAVDAFIRERMPGQAAKLNFPDMDPQVFAQELAQAEERRRALCGARSRRLYSRAHARSDGKAEFPGHGPAGPRSGARSGQGTTTTYARFEARKSDFKILWRELGRDKRGVES